MLKIQTRNGLPEIHPEDLKDHATEVRLIDVRNPDEFTGELGHIAGAKLVTLGPALMEFLESADKSQETVFVCRSGGRSGHATMIAQDMGFTMSANMTGGMLLWNQLQFPTQK